MPVVDHARKLNVAFSLRKPPSFIETTRRVCYRSTMNSLAERMTERRREIGRSNAAIARALDMSEQRIGQYMNGRRVPDIATLARLARQLETTPDDLLGVKEGAGVEFGAVIARLFELEGSTPARAAVLAQVAMQALSILRALPGDPTDPARARIAVQAVWTLQASR